jgi:pSer/pThr/pTyr-binding forkhead associated (FHA) protein
MFKLMVVVIIVVLLIRYVPAVRVRTAAKLHRLADELRYTQRASELPRGTPFVRTTHETELAGTRVLPSRTPIGLFSLAGETFSLRDGMTIGRGYECDIRIADSRASRLHARIRVQRGAAKLEDLGSRNGTRVNGKDIATPYTLIDGDRISFGGTLAGRFAYDRDTKVMRRQPRDKLSL